MAVHARVYVCTWRLLAHISQKPEDHVGAWLAAEGRSVKGAGPAQDRGLVG